jgi:hypothetical protein
VTALGESLRDEEARARFPSTQVFCNLALTTNTLGWCFDDSTSFGAHSIYLIWLV